MNRRKYTKKQIVDLWTAAGGKCWRCGEKIRGKPTPVYGLDWHLGHAGAAHWSGGMKVAPEHAECNREDAKEQTTAAAKSVRIRARDIGVRKLGPPMPGTKRSKWKHKLSGEWVKRNE